MLAQGWRWEVSFGRRNAKAAMGLVMKTLLWFGMIPKGPLLKV